MKKSVGLFIGWGCGYLTLCVVAFLLRFGQMVNEGAATPDNVAIALVTFAIVFTGFMMYLIRKKAREEKITWLMVVSKVLLICMGVFAAMEIVVLLLKLLIG